jgi:hypothetical protein
MKTLLIISLLSTICSGLTVSGNETVNITGRMGVGNLVCLDNSIAYIYNLTGYSQITSITASGDSKVLFDVPVLNFSYQDGLYGAGSVSGVCSNRQNFYCDIADSETIGHIHQIPEPISFILLVSGVLVRKLLV